MLEDKIEEKIHIIIEKLYDVRTRVKKYLDESKEYDLVSKYLAQCAFKGLDGDAYKIKKDYFIHSTLIDMFYRGGAKDKLAYEIEMNLPEPRKRELKSQAEQIKEKLDFIIPQDVELNAATLGLFCKTCETLNKAKCNSQDYHRLSAGLMNAHKEIEPKMPQLANYFIELYMQLGGSESMHLAFSAEDVEDIKLNVSREEFENNLEFLEDILLKYL